jgi:formylglycine-generating enzyme required for sulfatase activity
MAFLDRTERLRQLIPRYWQPFVSLIALCASGLNGLERFLGRNIPLATGNWWYIGLGLALFITVRFPRVFTLVTRGLLLLVGAPKPPPNPPSLFRGPHAYRRDDTLPGRQRDIDACWECLQDSTFLILEGESGCGKSSLLNAALLPRAQEVFRVVECRIADDPFGKLHAALLGTAHGASGTSVTARQLAQTIAQVAQAQRPGEPDAPEASRPMLVCIDQCEELFVTVRDERRVQFFTVLQEAVQNGQIRLIVAIRSDFRDLLYHLCRTVDPQHQALDPGSYYLLQAFRRGQAEAVLDEILRPIRGDDPLLRQQLEEFAQALVGELLRPPRDTRLCQDDEPTVLPVELQTVGMMIERVGIAHFSVSGFRRQGGKAGLLRRYIEQAKEDAWRRTGIPADRTLLILRQLISPARTRQQAQTAATIGADLRLPAEEVEQVLDAFAEQYLVNRLPGEPADGQAANGKPAQRYELLHEHLVQILAEAPDPILQQAQDAEERLRFWVARSRATTEIEPDDRSRKLTSRVARRVRSWFATPIPVLESLRLRRFTRSAEERRMLRHNLHGFALRSAVIVLILLPGALLAYDRLITAERRRADQNMGTLWIRNPAGADLRLRRIKHYREPEAYPAEDIPVNGTTVYLPGPADYMLEARKGQTERAGPIRYPVYITGYGQEPLTVTIQPPPNKTEIPEDTVYIPGGSFRMGDKDQKDSYAYSDESPPHDVTVDGFFLDRYEVTNARYRAFIDANGYQQQQHWTDDGWQFVHGLKQKQPSYLDDERFNKPQQPVVGVSWYEADAYCRWQNKRHAKQHTVQPCPANERSCLPTEAEWEKAARGPEGYKWAFGNTFDASKANSGESNTEGPVAVGSYDPNSYGLYDMSGNVWEWVADWYDEQFYSKPEASQKNPVNQTPGDERLRVVRGGAWDYVAELLRAAHRFRLRPYIRYYNLGFRCVVRPPE